MNQQIRCKSPDTNPAPEQAGGSTDIVSDSANRSPSAKRYLFIDSLRCFAILGVISHHVIQRQNGVARPIEVLAHQGFEGVQLFFVMSAFTLFLSLDSRSRSDQRPYLDFFIRRFFRIAPLFYAGLVFYTAMDYVFAQGAERASESLGCFLSTLTFTNGWHPRWINRLVPGGWSIAVEMNFYLLVPAFFLIFQSLRRACMGAFVMLLGAAAAKAALYSIAMRFMGPDGRAVLDQYTGFWLPLQLPIFCLGFVLFFIAKPILADRPEGGRRVVTDASFLLAVSAYLMIAISFSEPSLYLGHMLFGVAFVLLGWSLAIYANPLLVNPLTRFLGKVSFSAYMTHFAVLDLVRYSDKHGFLGPISGMSPTSRFFCLLALTIAGTAAASYVTYRCIEEPGINLGRAIIRHLEASGKRRNTPQPTVAATTGSAAADLPRVG